MEHLTFGQFKPTIARIQGISQTDSRLASYTNEAVQRLLPKGDWQGTVVRYRCCVNDAKLTWPRPIATIRKCSLCNSAMPIANDWYEFAANGTGILADDDAAALVLLDMGEACSFDDIEGSGKKIKVVSDVAEDADARILIRYYDSNNNWVRTTDSGSYVDGEYVSIGTTGAYTTNVVSNLVSVVKPATNGNVRLYEYDTATTVLKPLAIYEHDELTPIYRRSRIPGLENMSDCGTSSCQTGYKSVNVLAKLRYIPVSSDNDRIIISNMPALKDMVQAIKFREEERIPEAISFEKNALRELQEEVTDYKGAGGYPRVDVQDSATWGFGSIEGVI